MATRVQLVGGPFEDSEGNVLANGYLIFRLNQDCQADNSIQVCSGISIKILLDSSGNIASSASSVPSADQYIWANNDLLPVNSYYTVTGYASTGQPAWGPNNQQVEDVSGNPFNVSTWIPNQVFSWSPPLQPLVVEVNGVPIGASFLANFVNTSSVSFANPSGGEITATASVSRTTALFYVIDGGGSPITTGAKGQLDIPASCTIKGWVITADQSGSAVVDILRSSFAGFPGSLASIAGTDKPTLSAAQSHADNTLSGWGSTALVGPSSVGGAGDQIQFYVDSASTVTRLNITLVVTVP